MSEPIRIAPFPAVEMRDWSAVRKRFRARAPLPFKQAWRPNPEPLFVPGKVRCGVVGMSLAVLAEFRDHDVFNPVTHFNVPAFPHGDVFEIFLQPVGQDAYYEFHVTPGGTLLQLRWPGPMREIG